MARVTRKAQRENDIRSRAREMAASGEYGGWLIIEQVLRFQRGYPEARSVLDNAYIREELDDLCRRAKAEQEQSQTDD